MFFFYIFKLFRKIFNRNIARTELKLTNKMSGPCLIQVEYEDYPREIETKDEKSVEVQKLKETFKCDKFVSLSYINKDGKPKN